MSTTIDPNSRPVAGLVERTVRRVLRWLCLAPALLPAGCHYNWTGPALWAHNSTGAFDAWVGLWILALAIPVWTAIWALRA